MLSYFRYVYALMPITARCRWSISTVVTSLNPPSRMEAWNAMANR